MIRVLIVDDSAVVRKILTEELSGYADIEVVGSAVDPYVARDKIVRLQPDVLTLDIQMPRMDGLSFLRKLMKYSPLPVVIVSSMAKDTGIAIQALEMGAVEVLAKPEAGSSLNGLSRQLARSVRAAAGSNFLQINEKAQVPCKARFQAFDHPVDHRVLAIGASTGGATAIAALLGCLPASSPGIVVVQHMPEGFTSSFARRLDSLSSLAVKEAQDGDPVLPGSVLIAPGNRHLLMLRHESGYFVRVKDGPAVHFQRPSVDVLFQSVARSAGSDAIGVLLTGMGADGARGLLAMRQRGAYTLVQDEETCVVFGMPKEAIKLGAAHEVAPLLSLADGIVRALRKRPGKSVKSASGESSSASSGRRSASP